VSEKLAGCAKCGAPLEQPKVGRPRLYCGDLCRQTAAFELRRVTRLLGGLEAQASHLRSLPDDATTRATYGSAWRDRLRLIEAQIAASERRLRVLLGKPRGRPLSVPRNEELLDGRELSR